MTKRRQRTDNSLEIKLDLFKEHFDEHFQNINSKLGSIDARLDGMDKVSVEQHAVLKEHVRRTDLLEKHVEITRKQTDEKIEPIRDHVKRIETIWDLSNRFGKVAIKIILAGIALGGTGLGVEKLIKIFIGE